MQHRLFHEVVFFTIAKSLSLDIMNILCRSALVVEKVSLDSRFKIIMNCGTILLNWSIYVRTLLFRPQYVLMLVVIGMYVLLRFQSKERSNFT